jgi:hypothetical protein
MDLNKLLNDSINSRKSIEDYINNVVNQYIVKPSSGSPTGIGGFIFNILDKESIRLTAQITDHYVENNYAYQDHIALQPERFILRGYVGEIADIIPSAAISVLTNINSLANIAPFMNEFSLQASQAYAKISGIASRIGSVINQAQNIFDIFNDNSTFDSKQQKAYAYFYSLWSSRVLVDVETPYNVLKNMGIEDIEITQNGDSKYISDFAVTFKKIRIATTKQFTQERNKILSKFSEAPDLSKQPLTTAQIGKDRAAAMLAVSSSGGSTSGSSFNFLGQSVGTDLLSN